MKLKTFLHLAFVFLLISFSFSEATIRYVSTTGSSTPPYLTWKTAADSIQKAISISLFRDTSYFIKDTYEVEFNNFGMCNGNNLN